VTGSTWFSNQGQQFISFNPFATGATTGKKRKFLLLLLRWRQLTIFFISGLQPTLTRDCLLPLAGYAQLLNILPINMTGGNTTFGQTWLVELIVVSSEARK
jgi:hypothetical protein